MRRVPGRLSQLVEQQARFFATHAAEIRDEANAPERREALADAAGSSLRIHNDGTGAAFGTGRWYRTVVEAVSRNIDDLIEREGWSWRRYLGEPVFVIVDALVLGGFVAALAAAAV